MENDRELSLNLLKVEIAVGECLTDGAIIGYLEHARISMIDFACRIDKIDAEIRLDNKLNEPYMHRLQTCVDEAMKHAFDEAMKHAFDAALLHYRVLDDYITRVQEIIHERQNNQKVDEADE